MSRIVSPDFVSNSVGRGPSGRKIGFTHLLLDERSLALAG
jgi:hypothetical protein